MDKNKNSGNGNQHGNHSGNNPGDGQHGNHGGNHNNGGGHGNQGHDRVRKPTTNHALTLCYEKRSK